MQRLHPMGINRALTAMELRAIAALLRASSAIRNPAMKASNKAGARRMLQGLRDLRQIIGADGYRLP